MQVVLARPGELSVAKNPLTPKASLIRYWSKKIDNNAPQSEFLLSKASPLTAVDSATFTKLAEQKNLSTHLPQFCSAANLLCFPDLSASLDEHSSNASFSVYGDRNFTNYGIGGKEQANSFKNYSSDENISVNSFKHYSRNSDTQDAKFSSYSDNGNIADQSFNSYGGGGVLTEDGKSNFDSYESGVNVPNLNFKNYGANSDDREQAFKTYTTNANHGNEKFTSYSKNSVEDVSEFQKYAEDSNVIESDFANYAEAAILANQTFSSYGLDGNIPVNNFKHYGAEGILVNDTFISYQGESNVGISSFESYGKKSHAAEESFINYNGSINGGASQFKGYRLESSDKKVGFTNYDPNDTFKVGFTNYSPNDTFKAYQDKDNVSFAGYSNVSNSSYHIPNTGRFFRESMLREGNTMPMPDIRDKMPKRSFLPRAILSKLPFSISRIGEMKKIFHAAENSTMEKMIVNSLHECERAPSEGETKQCAGSIEDMIDFVTSVLGRNVVVRTTENTNGHNKNITIGSVKGINGGKVTKSVSCHQSLYPYLLYYCHSVPKVRVYDAEILDANTKAKINQGTAICHLDTSAWSPSHGAFLALGSSPGKIEVCHWIFENDMTWTIADN
ncbi:hypothetical protein ACFE04_002464 [Oxalis oulophora]